MVIRPTDRDPWETPAPANWAACNSVIEEQWGPTLPERPVQELLELTKQEQQDLQEGPEEWEQEDPWEGLELQVGQESGDLQETLVQRAL